MKPTSEKVELYIYRVEIWYRHGDNEKEFMQRTILSPTDEKMEELARQIRPNVFKVEIKSKEEYGKVRE